MKSKYEFCGFSTIYMLVNASFQTPGHHKGLWKIWKDKKDFTKCIIGMAKNIKLIYV